MSKFKENEYLIFYQIYEFFQKKIKQKLFGMISRCENPQNTSYKYYGKKGIKVCSLWKDHNENFIGWCLENNYMPGLEIHRLNPHKGYKPENCILCTKEDHIYYHQLIQKDQKRFNESLRVHNEIQKLFGYYVDDIKETPIEKAKKALEKLSSEQINFLMKNFKTDE